ncbi:MAG: hypothetical protein K1Y36_12970 [Blastocatellia bacterium]|nr:hypothetical protein [Blastocatellia bacterium]
MSHNEMKPFGLEYLETIKPVEVTGSVIGPIPRPTFTPTVENATFNGTSFDGTSDRDSDAR